MFRQGDQVEIITSERNTVPFHVSLMELKCCFIPEVNSIFFDTDVSFKCMLKNEDISGLLLTHLCLHSP